MDYSIVTHEDGEGMLSISNFLIENALKAKDCLPPPMLDIYAVAQEGGELLACCGASLARSGKLHLEKIYQLDEIAAAFVAERDETCEIGRWFSLDMDAALPVLRHLIDHLIESQVFYALCELKDATIRRTRVYGLEFIETNSKLNIPSIDPTEKKYYVDRPPRLYLLDLRMIEWK